MPSVEKVSEHRRINKPIMEKRRRARINDCLNELKSLVLEGLKKDPARHSKLEKADILEMAVRHVRSLQSRQDRYREGYLACRRHVAAYLSREGTGLDATLLPTLGAGLASVQLVAGPPESRQVTVLLPATVPLQSPPAEPADQTALRRLSVCTEASVGSPSPAPSWDPPTSPSSSVGSFGSSGDRADSPRPLDLVAHNRGPEEAHWRPW